MPSFRQSDVQLGGVAQRAIKSLKEYIDRWFPRGLVATAAKTAQQGGITTVTDISGLQVSYTAEASRRYVVECQGLMFSSVGGDILQVQITDLANNVLALAQLSAVANFGVSFFFRGLPATGAVGTQTYKVRMVRGVGTGTCTFDCGLGYPAFLQVFDVGPAPIP